MHHFFITPEQVRSANVYMEGSDVRHMNSALRMRTGELLTVSDQCGNRYYCRLERYEENRAVLSVMRTEAETVELSSRLYLFQGLAKGEKMEWIIQKAVELGAYEIIPVETQRSVVRLDAKKAAKKVERWRTIAAGGAKQSDRGMIPGVHDILSFEQALEYAGELDVLLIPYENAKDMGETRRIIAQIRPGQSVGIFIGPEGGFEETEIALANQYRARTITLGKRILRTETAGLALLSILMYHLEC